jgi:hypothetical protein
VDVEVAPEDAPVLVAADIAQWRSRLGEALIRHRLEGRVLDRRAAATADEDR